jgi:hypothetical protein
VNLEHIAAEKKAGQRGKHSTEWFLEARKKKKGKPGFGELASPKDERERQVKG